jgi:hypothetical protein
VTAQRDHSSAASGARFWSRWWSKADPALTLLLAALLVLLRGSRHGEGRIREALGWVHLAYRAARNPRLGADLVEYLLNDSDDGLADGQVIAIEPHGIWVAISEIRLPPDNPFGFGARRGYVNVFAPAGSEEEFRQLLDAWSEAERVELVEVSEVLPLHEFLDCDEKKLDCAIESLRSRELVPSFNLVDPAKWDEDPDADLLRASVAWRALVEFRYMSTGWSEFGFVLDSTNEWVLVQRVDRTRMALDGHVAARLELIVDARVVEHDESFVREALALVGARPAEVPELVLDSAPMILEFVERRFPLVRFSLLGESVDRVGRITQIGTDRATIQTISAAAEWLEPEEFQYDEIFIIEFGRAYEATLADVLASKAARS